MLWLLALLLTGVLVTRAYDRRFPAVGLGDTLMYYSLGVLLWPCTLVYMFLDDSKAPPPRLPKPEPTLADTPEGRELLRQVDRDCCLTVEEVLTPEESPPSSPPEAVQLVAQQDISDATDVQVKYDSDGYSVDLDNTAELYRMRYELEQIKCELAQLHVERKAYRVRWKEAMDEIDRLRLLMRMSPGPHPGFGRKREYRRLPGEFLDYAKNNFKADDGTPIEDHLGMPFIKLKDEVFDYPSSSWMDV